MNCDLYPWLETLIKSCSLLEYLDLLLFDLRYKTATCLNILSPSLRSLDLEIEFSQDAKRNKIFIDAPKLVKLRIVDPSTCYYFLQNPTSLLNSSLDLTKDPGEYDYNPALVETQEDYLHQMSKFIGGMCLSTHMFISIYRIKGNNTELRILLLS